MAIHDIDIIGPIESLNKAIVSRKKKEKNKKEQEHHKSDENDEQEQDASEIAQKAIMANNDDHLLDFKA